MSCKLHVVKQENANPTCVTVEMSRTWGFFVPKLFALFWILKR